MGGWAEELHALTSARQHHDVDLLLVDADNVVLEAWLERHTEITAKRLPHKRAVLVDDVLVELFLAHTRGADVTITFWGHFEWTLPEAASVVQVDGLELLNTAALAAYRADWSRIRSAGTAERRDAVDVHEALGIDFHWDVTKLWAADLPIVELHVTDLVWLLDLPIWAVGDRTDVRPVEVANEPNRFADEYDRTMRADLRYPINVIWLRDRWVALDGLHRLLKASIRGDSTITAKTAHLCDLPLFQRAADEPHNHP